MELLSNGTGLTAVVFLPLISALILTAIPKKQELLIKGFALVSSVVTFVISALLLPQFDFSNADKLQLGNKISWIKSINANYEIGIDGISLPLLILSTFISVLAIISLVLVPLRYINASLLVELLDKNTVQCKK